MSLVILTTAFGSTGMALAQESLRDVVLQDVPGDYSLVESGPNTSVRMIDEWNALPWRTSFERGTSIVEISAFDYRDLPSALAGHATMADQMESALRNSDAENADEEVVIRDVHPDEAGVTRVRWVLDGEDFAHLGFYIEDEVGYLVSVVDADAAVFDAILLAQLDHSPGERLATPLSDVGPLYEELTGGGGGSGGTSVVGVLGFLALLGALGAWAVWTWRRHGGGAQRPRHGDLR